jgi:polyphosphate kinase
MTVDERASAEAPSLTLPQPSLEPTMYINRELSLIDYQQRVFAEALDERNPLLERVKFVAIVGSMLDEFFMIRVSGIREQVQAGVVDKSPDGMTPLAEMAAIRARLAPFMRAQVELFTNRLRPELAAQGIVIADYEDLRDEQKAALGDYFDRLIFPVCTPLAVDPGHPFPHISNLSLNLAVELQDPDGTRHFARLKAPTVIPRLVALSAIAGAGGGDRPAAVYVWLEQILAAHLDALFPQMTILGAYPFRVIRDADIEVQEIEADDLLESVEQSLSQRRFGSTAALMLEPGMPAHLRALLVENLEITENDVYALPGPLGLSDLMELTRVSRPDLKDPPFTPRVPPALHAGADIFFAIQQGDILLHHPFDSFNPVVDFIRTAAADPNVLAIKQTLYRVGQNSPIIEALLKAAERGKQVAVLMELKARFDEENNIESARALEHAGVHVTYGLLGLKTHCKVALVVRREGDGIRRYIHLGTGNYNPSTARAYTDMGLLTCRPEFGADVSELFNYLTGYSKQARYRKLLVAPLTLRSGLLALIEREIKRQEDHGDGRLIFKMNGLVDPAFIEALYRASRAGVQVDLIVRGMCCLRPGVPGVSENIRVISILGRFLEHSRLYYFHRGGKGELWMGSADLMTRNLDHRVETLFPVEDDAIREYIITDVLEAYLRDNTKARVLQPNGVYTLLDRSEETPPYDAQATQLERVNSDPEMMFPLSALPKKYRKYLSKYGRVDPQE